jgi:hypothetical protein
MAKQLDASKRFEELLRGRNTLAFKLAETGAKLGPSTDRPDSRNVSEPHSFLLAEIGRTPMNWRTVADSDVELRALFQAARLNPESPGSWETLLRLFAIAHYRPQRKAGRHKTWGPDALWRLLRDVRDVKSRNPSLSEAAVCKHLAGPRKKYNCAAETLRRKLQDARNIQKNVFLREIYAQLIRRSDLSAGQVDELALAEAVRLLEDTKPTPAT